MTMNKEPAWRDPIVEEIYQHWEDYAGKFDFDLQKIFLDLRRQQEESGEPVVSFAPKPAPDRTESLRPQRRTAR
jgi:hypothetical protein